MQRGARAQGQDRSDGPHLEVKVDVAAAKAARLGAPDGRHCPRDLHLVWGVHVDRRDRGVVHAWDVPHQLQRTAERVGPQGLEMRRERGA